jgi:hypothetical protein
MVTPCGEANSRGSSFNPLAFSLPVPREQLVQLMAFGPSGDDALQHVGQIGLRIEIV